MKFTLIVGSKNRTAEFSRLLTSLTEQTYKNFQLIIIDQNEDDRIPEILREPTGELQIQYFRQKPGLSRARNLGMQHAGGDIIGFPDDDCWYTADFLQRVHDWFQSHPRMHGLSGCSQDGEGHFSNGRWSPEAGEITRHNLWTKAISYTVFVRHQLCETVGEFDITLGVGSGTELGSGEESDYLCRALDRKFRLFYDPAFVVCHDDLVLVHSEDSLTRAFRYGSGFSYVLKKNRYPQYFIFLKLLRPLGGVLTSILSGRFFKARFHREVFRGRLNGLKIYRQSDRNSR